MKLQTYDGWVNVKRGHVKDYCKHFNISMKDFKRNYTFDEVEYLIADHWPKYIPQGQPNDILPKRRLHVVK